MDYLNYCCKFLEKNDLEIFVCLNKKEENNLIISLFCLNLEFAKIFSKSSEKEIAQLKFNWWIDAISEIYQKNSKAREHPVLLLLKEVIEKYQIPKEDLMVILDVRKFDLGKKKFKNFSEFKNYVDDYLYQIFKLISGAQNIELNELLKNYCYVLKLIRVINSLSNKNYNTHPFISEEVIKKVGQKKAFERNQAAIDELKNQIRNLISKTDNFKSDLKFINNFQYMVKFQAKNCLKYSSYNSVPIFSEFKFKLFNFVSLQK